jgi:hypothetical protein
VEDIFLTMQTGKSGTYHISRAHMCTLCYTFRGTAANPSLAPYDGAPGNIIEAKFYSFGMYRRGGRSQVTTRRAGGFLSASRDEIVEHGWWRIQHQEY